MPSISAGPARPVAALHSTRPLHAAHPSTRTISAGAAPTYSGHPGDMLQSQDPYAKRLCIAFLRSPSQKGPLRHRATPLTQPTSSPTSPSYQQQNPSGDSSSPMYHLNSPKGYNHITGAPIIYSPSKYNQSTRQSIMTSAQPAPSPARPLPLPTVYRSG